MEQYQLAQTIAEVYQEDNAVGLNISQFEYLIQLLGNCEEVTVQEVLNYLKYKFL